MKCFLGKSRANCEQLPQPSKQRPQVPAHPPDQRWCPHLDEGKHRNSGLAVEAGGRVALRLCNAGWEEKKTFPRSTIHCGWMLTETAIDR